MGAWELGGQVWKWWERQGVGSWPEWSWGEPGDTLQSEDEGAGFSGIHTGPGSPVRQTHLGEQPQAGARESLSL